jgi:hypothetical protein
MIYNFNLAQPGVQHLGIAQFPGIRTGIQQQYGQYTCKKEYVFPEFHGYALMCFGLG